MKYIGLCLCIVLMATANQTRAQENNPIHLAKSYFSEMDSLLSLDAGLLWGISLKGPVLLVDQDSRMIIANQSDKQKVLKEKDGLYIGNLPDNVNMANTSLNWNGVNWTMVMWNALSPDDFYSRNKLLIHESWHRVQNEIGIVAVTSQNVHLDGLQGDILMKLEFMALQQALLASDSLVRVAYLKNALLIRKYRQAKFPANNENEFERHEGMAEYTGFRLCGLDQSIASMVVAKQLELAMDKDGLVNSFAYLTGPAYGYVFNELDADWIGQVIQGKGLPEIGVGIIGDTGIIPTDTINLGSQVSEIITQYHAEALITNETNKFEQQKKLISIYRKKIFEGNQLIIPNTDGLNFSFNPQEKLIPIDELGVVYPTMRLTGKWGILEVKDGIFRSNDWQVFIVNAPTILDSDTISAPGYALFLNEGWHIVQFKEGKYMMVKE